MNQIPYIDFAPRHIKFYNECGEEIHYTQVNKIDLVRQADYLAQQFFDMRWKKRFWFSVSIVFGLVLWFLVTDKLFF